MRTIGAGANSWDGIRDFWQVGGLMTNTSSRKIVIFVELFSAGRKLRHEHLQIIHHDVVAGWFTQIGSGLCRNHHWGDVAGDFCPLAVGVCAHRRGGGTLRVVGLVETVAAKWDEQEKTEGTETEISDLRFAPLHRGCLAKPGSPFPPLAPVQIGWREALWF
jgi:hypothetical protein